MQRVIRFGTVDYGLSERNALTRLLDEVDPQLTMGQKTYEFERAFAKWLGSKYAVFVNSGTSALLAALTAYKLAGHDNLVTSALTYPATWASLDLAQIQHTFKDVENDFVMYPKDTHESNCEYLSVHLLGKPCRVDFGVEDACEALGSKIRGKHVGTFGDLGCFSFYVAHQINTIEGGMVVTNREDLYQLCLEIRNNGRLCSCPVCTLKTAGKCSKRLGSNLVERKWATECNGYNFRPNELQAVLGLVKMGKIDSICEARHQLFKVYEETFGSMKERSDEYIVPLAYPVKVKDPQKAVARLLNEGIECRGMFPAISQAYENAYRISQNYILIPSHQGLLHEQVEYIIEHVKKLEVKE